MINDRKKNRIIDRQNEYKTNKKTLDFIPMDLVNVRIQRGLFKLFERIYFYTKWQKKIIRSLELFWLDKKNSKREWKKRNDLSTRNNTHIESSNKLRNAHNVAIIWLRLAFEVLTSALSISLFHRCFCCWWCYFRWFRSARIVSCFWKSL